jgi:hypothetical protein
MRADGNQPEAVRFDGETLTLRIPMRFQRHGGRKLIVGPDGEENWAPLPTGPDTTLIRALGRAHRWKRLIENGTYGSIKELATAEKVNDTYVGRILRLTLLAPDVVEVILDGRQPRMLQLKDLMRLVSNDWSEQRRALGFRS